MTVSPMSGFFAPTHPGGRAEENRCQSSARSAADST